MSVQILQPIGSLSMPRVVADCFDKDVLTLTSVDTDQPVEVLQPHQWLECTVLSDTDGHPVYTIQNSNKLRLEQQMRDQIRAFRG